MEKNKFISDKISKLMSEGKTREQSISIAYAMYERLPKGQQGGTNFYQGMFGQPQYTPPSELGFNQGQQYMGLGYDPNYVNQLSPESLKAGETFAQNNPLPQGIIPNEIGYESNIEYKEPTNNQTNYNNIYNDKILNPYGGLDLESTLAWTGQQFGQGDVGKGVAGSALSLFKGARTFMSGLGAGTENQRVQDEYYNNLRNPNYNYQMLQEGAIVALQPVPTTVNELISQGAQQEVSSNYRPIRKIQKGVTGSKGQSGAYYYYDKLPGEPGFDPTVHREFVTEQSMSEQRFRNITPELYNPELQKYEQSLGIKQEGGKVTNGDILTGQFITDMPQNPNVIIEDKEFVKNSETGAVQKAVGDTHMDDSKGIPVNLPEGSKVMSNYTKIGANNAKMFKENFDIKVSAKDTFADVMDKVNKKIGVEKLIKEEKEYLTTIEKQTKSSIDKTTKEVNLKFLADELKEIEDKKQELQQKQNEAFEIIFERQEMIAKKGDGKTILDENGQPMMQEGGMTQESDIVSEVTSMLQQGVSPEEIVNMLVQQGVSQEEAVQLIQAIIQEQPSQEVPMAQEGLRVGSKFEDPSLYKKQSATGEGWESFGELLASKPQEVLAEIKRVHPELYSIYFKNDKVNKNNIADFQFAVNKKYENILKDAESLYGKESPKVSELKTQIEQDKFIESVNDEPNIRATDAMLGNYTSTRPNFQLEVLPTEELKRVREAGVNTASELKNKFPDLYNTYVKGKNLNSDFWLGEIKPEVAPATTAEPLNDFNLNMPQSTPQTREVDRYSMLNMPVDFILPPSALQPVAKQSVQLGRLDPVKVSVEPNIQTAESQRTQATNALSFLPDSQRAAAIAQMLGQTQQATNQAISQAEMANASSQMQADQINMGQADKEQIMNKNFDAQYQNQMMTAITNTDRDIRQYFNALNDQQAYKFNYVERRNLANQMFDNYSVGNDGVNFKGGTPIVAQRDAQLDYLNQAYLNAKTPEEKNKLQQALQAHYAKKA